jgi:hypothetical protein
MMASDTDANSEENGDYHGTRRGNQASGHVYFYDCVIQPSTMQSAGIRTPDEVSFRVPMSYTKQSLVVSLQTWIRAILMTL